MRFDMLSAHAMTKDARSERLPSMAAFPYGTTDARPVALLIAGPPASGKSIVAAPLARTLGAVLLDLDVATEPMLKVIRSLANVDDVDDPRLATLTRADRYETITRLAEDNLRIANTVLLVAPLARNARISTPGRNSLIDFIEHPPEP